MLFVLAFEMIVEFFFVAYAFAFSVVVVIIIPLEGLSLRYLVDKFKCFEHKTIKILIK